MDLQVVGLIPRNNLRGEIVWKWVVFCTRMKLSCVHISMNSWLPPGGLKALKAKGSCRPAGFIVPYLEVLVVPETLKRVFVLAPDSHKEENQTWKQTVAFLDEWKSSCLRSIDLPPSSVKGYCHFSTSSSFSAAQIYSSQMNLFMLCSGGSKTIYLFTLIHLNPVNPAEMCRSFRLEGHRSQILQTCYLVSFVLECDGWGTPVWKQLHFQTLPLKRLKMSLKGWSSNRRKSSFWFWSHSNMML